MNIYKKHHLTKILMRFIIGLGIFLCFMCYQIGYQRGASHATQKTSDELLVACEVAIERAENSCVD